MLKNRNSWTTNRHCFNTSCVKGVVDNNKNKKLPKLMDKTFLDTIFFQMFKEKFVAVCSGATLSCASQGHSAGIKQQQKLIKQRQNELIRANGTTGHC